MNLNQRAIRSLKAPTLTAIKAITAGFDGLLSFCVETQTLYVWVTAGSSYTANNLSVLSTGVGGDTRWLGISGQYVCFPIVSPYLSYQALVSQSGTNDPTEVTLFLNQLGATMTWTRTSTGIYTLTANPNVFTLQKTSVIISSSYLYLNKIDVLINNSFTITFYTTTLSVSSGTLINTGMDGILNNLIEVRVYN